MSLKSRLVAYLRKIYPHQIASGELQRIVMQKTTYTPSNCSRRMRELENEGLVQVEYIKGHAHYRATPPQIENFYGTDGQLLTQKKTWINKTTIS